MVQGVPDKVDKLFDGSVAMRYCVIVSRAAKCLDVLWTPLEIENSLNDTGLVATLQDESHETTLCTVGCGADSNYQPTRSKQESINENRIRLQYPPETVWVYKWVRPQFNIFIRTITTLATSFIRRPQVKTIIFAAIRCVVTYGPKKVARNSVW